ncbi:hemocyte protein-glutamine gamma-glutamyltransferase [Tribolium castaneum]|uniref:protein-glutamine gamma-glutamyltransferase n=1 Tax=Tribolium castaneum TaxID=7070 RepID=D6WL52_TRICA|nr:PREDICTED: hemocyte protein-glutamine gamma-glutamyltransferase [Tribolium castaneum]XP_015836064.1 PREDICTED: hemocyte protein-glutamine gamma-glutamyltransferase [Tribolium castaneum]EFA03506.1 Hemocyte protein-glutamine gamma-glutamyltransferase-like Protein [Tribolium castaneum]|eukprot:XP_015836063.1 PREDICTED: hemocyte protein-glutamine gamma-glutamyltransferase [Tribolium castaneum]
MEPIEVQSTEFYPKDNARENHTAEYDLVNNPDFPTPILRRGCNFFFAIRFNRDFDEINDVVRVRFGFGPKPNVIRGTRAILPILARQKVLPKNTHMWSSCVTRIDGNIVMLQVHIPPNAQVGIWKCSIQTNISGQRDKRYDHKVEDDIYILFNPWCEDDGVYMPDEKEKQEYILNENGKIWCGTFKKPVGRHWIFGQFDDIVLPAAVLLLDKSGLAPADRGSPVLVTRAISAVINSVDDDGLLEGRWDGNYSDGTSPHAWTGSVAILDQYLRTGGTPMKYGQCWVFSAATVSVCRALGIPCRSVTNYVSAHDTNCSLTVDKYFDLFGNKIENGPEGDCNDSCWNFHVWNDVWMTRPDLPPGYGGWQIIDATPQEQSDRIFRCGPASVEAVRKGLVGYLYDTPFVFSEVNADIIHFQEDQNSDWGFSRLKINQYHVGRKIVTKRSDLTDEKGDSDMWNITSFYKNLEGTEAERLAVYNAVKGVPKAQHLYDFPSEVQEDVFFDLVDIDSIPFGENFEVRVEMENRSGETRTISAVLSASSIFYTGVTASQVKRLQQTFTLDSNQKETLKITITPEEYLDKLVDHGLIKIYAIANVKETKQTWSEEDDFTLIKPEITVEIADACKVGEDCSVSLSFQNPLDLPLTDCIYTIEGLQKPKTVQFRDVQPKETVNISDSFKAKRPGERRIVVNFNSRQMQGISGTSKVTVLL